MLVMERKPWLESYPKTVPGEVAVDRYSSLVALFEEAFRAHAQRDATECMGERMSFRTLDSLSSDFGAWLQSQGFAKGTRVALMMPNLPQYCVALVGVLRTGLTVVNVNPLYTARELEHQLVDSGAECLVVLENFASVAEEVIARTSVRRVVLVSMGDLLGFWKGQAINFAVRHLKKMVPEFEFRATDGLEVVRFNMAIALGAARHLQRVEVGPDDIAFLQYTGGTTGISKGAMLLHRNVVANILQVEAWFNPMLGKVGTRQLTIVCALPLYHIFALTVCFLMGCRMGSLNILIPNPRDLPGLVKTLSRHKVNMFPAVNTLYNALANDTDFARLDFSELWVSNGGGMAVQQATAQRWKELTGCPIVEGYGLSETSPVATSNRLDIDGFTGTIGLPVPNTDISIRDDDGREVDAGDSGEICIRGPQVMAGYWRRPDETAKVMTEDGFFRSGDIGVMDERGYVRIVDRKKDMILVSGFNVYPTEIEQVVSTLEGVLECAAVGIPDAKSGEAVKLFVVRKESSLAEDDVAGFCARNLTAYKRPKYIEFRDELPKSNVGKILRRELRQAQA